METCGAPQPGTGLVSVDVTKETVVQGTVSKGGRPLASAFVRLLDADGDFAAEVVSGPGGEFRFFAAPGRWIVRALATGAVGEVAVRACPGVNEVALVLT